MCKEDKLVKCVSKFGLTLQIGPSECYPLGMSQNGKSITEFYLPHVTWCSHRCGALMNVPSHSYHPVCWFIRSLLVSCEKGEVMSNIEAHELLVK